MRSYDVAFQAALTGALDTGVRPAWFLWVIAKDRSTGADEPVGLWSGDEPVSVTVALPDGSTASRAYFGQVGMAVDSIPLGVGLEDRPVTVTLSQIADPVQDMLRVLDARHAYCELHAGLFDGGALVSAPQLEFVGIVDEAPINTPAAGGEGSVALSIRDEMLTQLSAINPAKSSDAHQRRRQAGDTFSVYSGVIGDRELQWYRK